MAERSSVNLNLVLVAGLAVGGYLLYRALAGVGSRVVAAGGQALTSAQGGVTNLLTELFPAATTTATAAAIASGAGGATVILGDGSEIPFSSVSGVGAFTDVDNVLKLQFYYQGKIYRTTSAQPDSTNTYYAASTTG
jgi:hypothetical protein